MLSTKLSEKIIDQKHFIVTMLLLKNIHTKQYNFKPYNPFTLLYFEHAIFKHADHIARGMATVNIS